MVASYMATKKIKTLTIAANRQTLYDPKNQVIQVSGKVEARKICKKNNITPWNF